MAPLSLPANARELSRRRFLRAACGCALGGAAIHASALEPQWLEVTEHDVPVPALPASLRGLRIAHLSDLHLSAIGALHDRVLREVRSRDPQIIVLTGDVIEDASALKLLEELTHGLSARGREVIATRGNWEHWGHVPLELLRDSYHRSGATLLSNEYLQLRSGMVVVGMDDACTGHAEADSSFGKAPASVSAAAHPRAWSARRSNGKPDVI